MEEKAESSGEFRGVAQGGNFHGFFLQNLQKLKQMRGKIAKNGRKQGKNLEKL